MANTYFQFKQFIVHQDKTAMKVGTDGVILGALAASFPKDSDVIMTSEDSNVRNNTEDSNIRINTENSNIRINTEYSNLRIFSENSDIRILDIGTGTGLVALMLAQRFNNAEIKAVEIDSDAAQQAKVNFEISPFSSRLSVENIDIKTLPYSTPFDLIVSNPPYFVDSLKAPDSQRNMARHTDSLSFAELASSVNRLLSADGLAVIIIPTDALQQIVASFDEVSLYPVHITSVHPNLNKPSKRSVVTFMRSKAVESIDQTKYQSKTASETMSMLSSVPTTKLVIEQAPRVYTDQFRELVSPFYLNC